MEELDDPIGSAFTPAEPAPSQAQTRPAFDQGAEADDPLSAAFTQTAPFPEEHRQIQYQRAREQVGREYNPDANWTIRKAFAFPRDIITNVVRGRAERAIQAGTGTEQDYKAAAEIDLERESDARRAQTIGGAVGQAAMSLPSEAVGFLAGGRLAGPITSALGMGGAGVGPFLGRTAVGVAATPNLGLASVIRQNVERGRDPFDIRGVPEGGGLSFAEMAMMGAVAKVAGVKLPDNAFGQAIASGLSMPVGQQLVDLAAHGLKLKGDYGTMQQLMEGKYGEAARDVVTQVFTGAAFSLLHGGDKFAREKVDRFNELLNEEFGRPPEPGGLPPGPRPEPPPGGAPGGRRGGRRGARSQEGDDGYPGGRPNANWTEDDWIRYEHWKKDEGAESAGRGRRRTRAEREEDQRWEDFFEEARRRGERQRRQDADPTGAAAGRAADRLAREVLGVDANAGPEEIAKAFRKFARENHPDRGGRHENMVWGTWAHEFLTRDPNAPGRPPNRPGGQWPPPPAAEPEAPGAAQAPPTAPPPRREARRTPKPPETPPQAPPEAPPAAEPPVQPRRAPQAANAQQTAPPPAPEAAQKPAVPDIGKPVRTDKTMKGEPRQHFAFNVGDKPVDLRVVNRGDSIEVEWMGFKGRATGEKGEGSMRAADIKAVAKQLFEQNPEAERITSIRGGRRMVMTRDMIEPKAPTPPADPTEPIGPKLSEFSRSVTEENVREIIAQKPIAGTEQFTDAEQMALRMAAKMGYRIQPQGKQDVQHNIPPAVLETLKWIGEAKSPAESLARLMEASGRGAKPSKLDAIRARQAQQQAPQARPNVTQRPIVREPKPAIAPRGVRRAIAERLSVLGAIKSMRENRPEQGGTPAERFKAKSPEQQRQEFLERVLRYRTESFREHIQEANEKPTAENIARVTEAVERLARMAETRQLKLRDYVQEKLPELHKFLKKLVKNPGTIPHNTEVNNAIANAKAVAQNLGIDPKAIERRIAASLAREALAATEPEVDDAAGQGILTPAERRKLNRKRGAHKAKITKALKAQIPMEYEEKAVAAGLDPEELHQRAEDLIEQDKIAIEGEVSLWNEAMYRLKKAGYNAGSLRKFAADDHNKIKGFDGIAQELAKMPEGRAILGVSDDPDAPGEDASNALWEFLQRGEPQPISLEDAYDKALRLMEDNEYAIRSANQQLRRTGQPPLTNEDIERVEEQAERELESESESGTEVDSAQSGAEPTEVKYDSERGVLTDKDGVELFAGIPIPSWVWAWMNPQKTGRLPAIPVSQHPLPPLPPYEIRKAVMSSPRGAGRVYGIGPAIDPRARAKTGDRRAVITYRAAQEMGETVANKVTAELSAAFNGKDPFHAGKDGRVLLANGQRRAMADVIESEMQNPGSQPLTAEQRRFVKLWTNILAAGKRNAQTVGRPWEDQSGAPLSDIHFPRAVYETARGKETSSHHTKARMHDTEESGIVNGAKYEPSSFKRVAGEIRQFYDLDARHQLLADPDLHGQTSYEWFQDWQNRHAGMLSQLSVADLNQKLERMWLHAQGLSMASDQPGSHVPMFRGRIYPDDIAKRLSHHFAQDRSQWLSFAEGSTDLLKSITLGVDAAIGQLQLAPLAFSHPTVWARSQLAFFRKLATAKDALPLLMQDPEMRKVANLWAQYGGGLSQPLDFLEGGSEKGLVGRIPYLGRPFHQFERSNVAALDTAKLLLFRQVLESGAKPETLPDHVQRIENAIGLGQSQGIGVSRGARTAERLAVNAPSYYRSAANVLGEMLFGGGSVAKGTLQFALGDRAGAARSFSDARQAGHLFKTFGAFFAGVGLVSYLAMKASGMKDDEIQRRMDPKNPKFMMAPVAGQDIGLGGLYRALLKLGAEAVQWHKDGMPVDGQHKNPYLKFLKSREAFGLRLLVELSTQEDYRGAPQSMTQAGLGVVVPTTLRTILSSEHATKEQKAAAIIAEFFGMRNMPAAPVRSR